METGQVDFQLEATDQLQLAGRGAYVPCQVAMAHLHFWYHQVFHPFVLVLDDAAKHRALWLDVQAYIDENAKEFGEALGSEAATLTVRIPTTNRLTVNAIDQFRKLLLDRKRFRRKESP